MRRLILFATSYPYTAAILAIIWLGSAVLLKLSPGISLTVVLSVNTVASIIIAAIGFRK